MMVSKNTLKILAAVVWYIGGIVLLLKATDLLFQAYAIQPHWKVPALAIGIGILVGLIKSRFLFMPVCRKNLARIDQLSRPRFWQAYRTRFYFELAAMITLGVSLSRMAEGDLHFLMGVSALDYSLAVALLTSSIVFWRNS
ncbi:MAG: hypothetical protein GXO78_01700 [Calditrichaeota bacterium]|nr:hypothetical protein [Calditrichota bacterium]